MRWRFPRLAVATCAGLLVLSLPEAARAQFDTRVDVQAFEPAFPGGGYLTVLGTELPSHLEYGVGLVIGYQRDPLVVRGFDAKTWTLADERTRIVGDQLMAHVVAAGGLFGRLGLRLVYPFAFFQAGHGLDALVGGAEGIDTVGGGDLKVHLKGRIFGGGRGPSLAVDVGAAIPTAFGDFLGSGSFALHPRLDIGFRWDRFRAALEVGYLWTARDTVLLSTAVGDQLTYGGATAVRVHDRVEAIVEVVGRFGLSSELDESTLEVGGAVRIWLTDSIAITAGGGAGIMRGIGTPLARGFAGVTWEPTKADRDGDGLLDRDDGCPGKAEDVDGFRDLDGCPELDNDADGVPDVDDPCPETPGDAFSKTRGCPMEKEVVSRAGAIEPLDKGPAAVRDGTDTDGDGVPDAVDSCPDAAEDFEPPDPADGCPVPGAEGAPGAETAPGALDSDEDGIPDATDACPKAAESVNGVDDADGCPDADSAAVLLAEEGDRITLLRPIGFTKAKLAKGAGKILNDLARLLDARSEISRIRIEVAAKKEKMALVRAEVIRAKLVKRGIAAERMEVGVAAPGGEPVVIRVLGPGMVLDPDSMVIEPESMDASVEDDR